MEWPSVNQMDITIYVKWSCNLEHPEHPEKAEQIRNGLITFKISHFIVLKELFMFMNKDQRLISYMFCKILLLVLAIWVGSYGNIYIGIASFIIGCLMMIAGILQLNKMDYVLYGSILLLLSASSIGNYRNDIHNPVSFFHKYSDFHLELPPYIEAHQNILTALIIVCIIICIIYLQGAVGKMLLIWDCFLSFIASMIEYLFLHDGWTALFIFALAMLFMIFHAVLSIKRSIPYGYGIHILTLIDIPFFTVHYINGHDVTSKKYGSEEWKSQPVETKKASVKQEAKQFAAILPPGKYLAETHEVMIHLLESNFSPNVKVVKNRKFPALLNSKANSEFRTIYGKDWKMISGKRKLYIWYFELSST